VSVAAAKTVDAHHHVWDLDVRDQDWITGDEMAAIRRSFAIDDLRPLAAASGVTATIMVQTATLAELKDLPGGQKLVGIRHQVQSEPDPGWLRRSEVLRGLRAVADAGLVYDLIVRPHQLEAATDAAAAVPGMTFVLDHGGKPPIASGVLEPWARALRALAARPNVVCKLSGLVTEAAAGTTASGFAPYVDVILNAFGPDRVMFGSDWPVCLLATGYAEVVDLASALVADLGKAERTAVFATTATRVYLDGKA